MPSPLVRPLAAAASALLLAATANAQDWFEDFETYAVGAALDPGGELSIGNGWESWSSGLGSATVADMPAAASGSKLMRTWVEANTINHFTDQPAHPTNGPWTFRASTYFPDDYVGRTYWILLNTYAFGGPYSWSTQAYFDGDLGVVDCDCQNLNDPAGPPRLVRGSWVPIRAEIDLDLDTVELFYDNRSLTGGQRQTWTTGVFGSSNGILEIQALNLCPEGNGWPHTSECFFDDLSLTPAAACACGGDPLCQPVPNSTGQPALATLMGSGIAGEVLEATCAQGPAGAFGYFLTSRSPGLYVIPPGSVGRVCLSSPIYRYNSIGGGQVFQFDSSGVSQALTGGVVRLPTDGSYVPVPAAVPGTTGVFQAWYRDGTTSNFSDSVIVHWL